MKTNANHQPTATPENVIPFAIQKPERHAPRIQQRFKIQEFTNRTGSKSWRVTGSKRNGERVRENFSELQAAQCRRIELEAEYHAGHSDTAMRATRLSHEQIQLAEVACIKLGEDWLRLLDAVDHWLTNGKQKSRSESPRLDDAVSQFNAWLEATPTLRGHSKNNLRIRLNVFANSVGNLRLADIEHETIEAFLDKRQVSPVTKTNDNRALSRFFSWCIERPRRWTTINPCREIKIEKGEKSAPAILSVETCQKLLAAAERYKGGRLAPYFAVSIFGGLRPSEAARLTWPAVNLEDGTIRLEGIMTKTGRPRVVAICPTLRAWLKASKGREFFPANWREDFDIIREAIGFGTPTEDQPHLKPWPEDVLRHTSVSHFFRKTGSYGKTAEEFGNSEAIIKNHYQGRVTTEETKRFYAILPTKRGASK